MSLKIDVLKLRRQHFFFIDFDFVSQIHSRQAFKLVEVFIH